VLPAAQRLTSPSTFREVVRRGRRRGGALLVVHLLVPAADGRSGDATADLGPARAGLVVSKAVGPAVTRNRVKRRLRHLVRPRLEELALGSLLVLRALPGAADASFAELGAELERCLSASRKQV
jgi:ribonuclease P protein component